MKTIKLQTRLAVAAALVLAGCAGIAPPTSPEQLTDQKSGYVIGYLTKDEWPNSLAFLPPPPIPGSAAFAADEEAYKTARKLRGTPRWAMAEKDADLNFPHAAEAYSCALNMTISQEKTPHLNILLRRVRNDASRATDIAKNFYKRQRPYLAYGDQSCTPQQRMKDDSYPSGHNSIGWAWALVLAEIAPDKADAILERGLAYGNSRIVCGVHWKSDTEAGRLVGAATVSRLHTNPVFTAQLALARKEVEAARAAGDKSTLDCAAEKEALFGK